MLPNKSVLILSSSLVLGILFVFFVETIVVSKYTEKEALYQSGVKEGKFAYLAKENMFPVDDNTVYANFTTMIVKSKEEVKGFIEGYHSFEK